MGQQTRTSVLTKSNKQLIGSTRSFGDWQLCSESQTLSSCSVSTQLNRTQYKLLAYFLDYPDTIVSKYQLFDILWPEGNANLDSVKVAISDMRKLLQDSSQSPHYIKTEGRNGYRWIAEDIRTTNQTNRQARNAILTTAVILLMLVISLILFIPPEKIPPPNLHTKLNNNISLKNATNVNLNSQKTSVAYFKNGIGGEVNQLHIVSLKTDRSMTINNVISYQWNSNGEMLAILHQDKNKPCHINVFSQSNHAIVENILCPSINNVTPDKLSVAWGPDSNNILLLEGGYNQKAVIWRYNDVNQQWKISNNFSIPTQANFLKFIPGFPPHGIIMMVSKTSTSLTSTLYKTNIDDFSKVETLPFSVETSDQTIINDQLFYISSNNKIMSVNIDQPSTHTTHHLIVEKNYQLTPISRQQILLNYYDKPDQHVSFQLDDETPKEEFQVNKIRLPKLINNRLYFLGGDNDNETLMVVNKSNFRPLNYLVEFDANNIVDFDVANTTTLITTEDTIYLNNQPIVLDVTKRPQNTVFTNTRLLIGSDAIMISYCIESTLTAERQCGTIDPETHISTAYAALPNNGDTDYFISPNASYLLKRSGANQELLAIPTSDIKNWLLAQQTISDEQISQTNWTTLYRSSHSYTIAKQASRMTALNLSDSSDRRFPKLDSQASTVFAKPIIVDIEY